MTLTARKLERLYEIKGRQVEKKEREIQLKEDELRVLHDAIPWEQQNSTLIKLYWLGPEPESLPDIWLQVLQKIKHSNVIFAREIFKDHGTTYFIVDDLLLTLEHKVACDIFSSELQVASILVQSILTTSRLEIRSVFSGSHPNISKVILDCIGGLFANPKRRGHGYNDLAEPIQQSLTEGFFTRLNRNLIDVGAFVAKYYRLNPAATIVLQHCGSFNFSFRLHWDDGKPDWLIRFPIPGKVFFVKEKYKNEVAVVTWLRQHTTIPVPEVVGHGTAAENSTGHGPFIIMTWVEGTRMYDIMKRKDQVPGGGDSDIEDEIDPGIEESVLRSLYSEVAKVLLKLWSMDFDKIGGFDFDCATDSLQINRGPLTMNMNDLVKEGVLSERDLSSGPFSSSLDYFMHLAKLHSLHLQNQPNSIYGSQDGREKYTCRHLLKSIIPLFTDMDDNNGPFKLFAEDLTPGNILVDPETLKVTGIIDWEFCYAAPAQLLASPPKWLLLKIPEHWVEDDGLESFTATYRPKLDMFIQEMEKHELSDGKLDHSNRLSNRMRRSMEDRIIWFNRAIRGGWSLDFITGIYSIIMFMVQQQ